jgi:glycosyltransferase involved in cell wall biosynthesis
MPTEEQIRLIHVVNADRVLRQFLQGQLRYMTSFGMRVAISGPAGPTLDEFARDEGVEKYSVPIVRTMNVLYDVRTIAALCRSFLHFSPHIVHAHTLKAGLVSMIAALITRVPVRVFHLRGLAFEAHSGSHRLLQLATRLSCTLADQVFSISPTLEQEVIRAGFCRASKIKTLANGSGNGLNAEEFYNPKLLPFGTREKVRSQLGIPQNAIVAGFLGRIVGDKGIVELMSAWRRIRNNFPNARLLLVGPFEKTDPIPSTIVAEMLNDPRVHLPGDQADPRPMLSAMDLLALPSYREGLGMAAIEAAAMELPVVATAISGCMDAVADHVTGMLVPPKDEESLAKALSMYLADASLRKRHGTSGRKRVLQLFGQKRVWNALYDEYFQLLLKKGFSPLPSANISRAA